MLHLDPERLAALADDEATAAEAAHLVTCAECASERDAYRSLRALALRERGGVLQQPLSDWSSLAERLHEEGVLGRGARTSTPRVRGAAWRRWSGPWLNAAAAVLLVLGGGVAGRWSVGASASDARSGVPVADTGTTLASNPLRADTTLTFRSVNEAVETLKVAEQTYRRAAAYISAQDTSADPARYRARLAALDRMSGAALAAVNEAPHDPVINQYYLSTLSARQATLRELDHALPSGVKLVSY
jgi:hypothetical protein